MILECDKCGAPLDVLPSSVMTRCAYCGARQRVTPERTRAIQTPANWQPPPQWTAHDASGNATRTLPYDSSKMVQKGIKYVVIWIVLMAAIPLIITILVVIFIFVFVARNAPSQGQLPSARERSSVMAKVAPVGPGSHQRHAQRIMIQSARRA